VHEPLVRPLSRLIVLADILQFNPAPRGGRDAEGEEEPERYGRRTPATHWEADGLATDRSGGTGHGGGHAVDCPGDELVLLSHLDVKSTSFRAQVRVVDALEDPQPTRGTGASDERCRAKRVVRRGGTGVGDPDKRGRTRPS